MENEQFGYCPQPDDLEYVLAEIRKCRADQDVKHGGEHHDDTHFYHDWLSLISKFRQKAYAAAAFGNPSEDAYEEYLIDIAAIAVAALQSHRRIKYRGRQ